MGLGSPANSMGPGRRQMTLFSTGLNQLLLILLAEKFWFASQRSFEKSLRLLRSKVAPLFIEKGMEFQVEYIKAVRNWKQHLPAVAALSGAYRKRSKWDDEVVPHSFTFIQRCSHPILLENKLKFVFFYCFGGYIIHLVPTRPTYVPAHSLRNAQQASGASRWTDASEIQSGWEWYVLFGKGVCVRFRLVTTSPFSSSWWYCAIICGTSNPKSSSCSLPKIFALVWKILERCSFWF